VSAESNETGDESGNGPAFSQEKLEFWFDFLEVTAETRAEASDSRRLTAVGPWS
jgi:hypothetical protein